MSHVCFNGHGQNNRHSPTFTFLSISLFNSLWSLQRRRKMHQKHHFISLSRTTALETWVCVCLCLCVVYTRITVMAHSFRLRLLLCDQCVTRVAPIQFFSISKKTRQFNLFPFRRKESTWNEAPRRMHRNRWNFSITIAYLVEKIHTLTMWNGRHKSDRKQVKRTNIQEIQKNTQMHPFSLQLAIYNVHQAPNTQSTCVCLQALWVKQKSPLFRFLSTVECETIEANGLKWKFAILRSN